MNEQKNSATRGRRLAFLGGLLSIFALLAPVGQASAAAPQPAWSLQVTGHPTNFPPGEAAKSETGPSYLLQATNIGGAPTTGEFTIIDELPEGLAVSPTFPPKGYYGTSLTRTVKMACSFVGRVVTCVGGKAGDGPLRPDEHVFIDIHVDVQTLTPSTLVNNASIEGGGAGTVSKATPTTVSETIADFGFVSGSSGLFGTTVNADGTTVTQASSHPYEMEIVGMNLAVKANPAAFQPDAIDGGVKNILTKFPTGVVINPQATPQCTEARLELETCPADSQVGVMSLTYSQSGQFVVVPKALYNLKPPAGAPAMLGAAITGGLFVHVEGGVDTAGDYGLVAYGSDILAQFWVAGLKFNLWGEPSNESHNYVRGDCLQPLLGKGGQCPPEEKRDTPFLTMPSACTGPLTTTVGVASWQHPNDVVERSFQSADTNGNPLGVDGCNKVEFGPTMQAQPSTNLADVPTGLRFALHVPQEQTMDTLAQANLKDSTVTLPAGVTINPSAADGLGSCTEAQIDIDGPGAATCPEQAKVATAEINSPLLEAPLHGAVYLAKPFENPFNSLLALYIAIYDPGTGVVLKLPGKVEADPSTGQLTAVFEENPQLPFSHLELEFFQGARSSLKSPAACGTYTTKANLVPWSTPEGADANLSDSFATIAAPGGGACPTSESQLPNRVSFDAGTLAPQAGAFSPFVLKITRPDGSQRLTGIDTVMPPGLTGKLVGIPYCSEAQIAAAQARSKPGDGALEQSNPSCPAASQVGTVTVGAGAGPTPLHVSGNAYMAGPYKGAPISLVIVQPAVAGPFDLGTVVVRTPLYVNPETAQIHAVSDPLPTILEGIPLNVRSIALKMDRPDFTLNPTSCDPKTIAGALTSSQGQAIPVSSPFQVGGCSSLAFKPKLTLRLKGGTKRGKNPALTAILTQAPGQANIAKTSVALPHSAFLDQAHIKTICTRVQFAQGAVPGANCPAGSIYGRAKAISPLLAEPLSGPVFLRSSSNKLPDLVMALDGQVDVVVVGRVDSVKGAIRNSFEAVPDAPVSKFILEMQGGKKGLIVNSTSLCRKKGRATVKMEGQNGKAYEFNPVIRTDCKGKPQKKKRHQRQ